MKKKDLLFVNTLNMLGGMVIGIFCLSVSLILVYYLAIPLLYTPLNINYSPLRLLWDSLFVSLLLLGVWIFFMIKYKDLIKMYKIFRKDQKIYILED